MLNEDLIRELDKIGDTLKQVKTHLEHKDQMNAALHMSSVRYTPLCTAVGNAYANVVNLTKRLADERD